METTTNFVVEAGKRVDVRSKRLCGLLHVIPIKALALTLTTLAAHTK